MYEKTIKGLLARNEEIKHKIPTIEESIRTYAQMTDNYRRELRDLTDELEDNNAVIELLKMKEDDLK